MSDVLKKFGRYFLLDQIAQGGMAEIYRARLATVDGAGRLLVIKRIQAGYGQNQEFLQMFKSEIKVTMGFNHANIVQVYDFGEEQNQPYIAMEFVDGKNLRQFMNRFNELKKPFPTELTVHIIEQAACGLHYAHSFKDKISGEPLNIVHRDISPQNILISYEGSTKVIDFGIAKAATNNESTRAGVIKGKPSYLSPEQITGEQLDGRCDIFALGIVLWELLVGRKLFAGENDLAVLKLIESATTHIKPPSTFNTNVPKDLDAIVMKALTKQREKRYQTAEEMQRALHRFLYSFMTEFNPADLEYYAKDLFKNEIVEDRKRIQKLNDEAEKLLIASDLVIHHPNRFTSEGVPALDNPVISTSEFIKSTGSRDVAASESIKTAVVEINSANVKRAQRRPRTTTAATGRTKREPLSINPAQVGVRQGLQVAMSERSETGGGGGGSKKLWFAIAAVVGAVIFGGPIFSKIKQSLHSADNGAVTIPPPVDRSSASVPDDTPPPPAKSNVKTILLHLNIAPTPDNAKILVNQQEVDPSNPAIAVPFGPTEISIDSFSFRPYKREFVLDAKALGDHSESYVDVALDKLPVGYLTIRTSNRAKVILSRDGHEYISLWAPFEKQEIPVGVYTVRLIHEALGWERTLTNVQIREGELTWPEDDHNTREVRLNPGVGG